MGASFPGKGDLRSAPYQRVYAAAQASPVDLTSVVHQAKNAASGAIVQATGGAAVFAWKDCSGTACSLALDDNMVIDLPFAMTELTTNVDCIVVVYWHPSTPR